MFAKKNVGLFLAFILLFSSFSALAETKMIAPTVELRDGYAYSVAQRVAKDFPFRGTQGEKATKSVGQNGDAELIMNGGFEFKTGAAFSNWGVVAGTLDEKGAYTETEDVKDGKQAIRFTSETNVHVVQGINKCTAGEYELSAWCKKISNTGTPVISLIVYYADPSDGFAMEAKTRPTMTFDDAPVGAWVFRTFRFTMPAEVTQVSVMTRLFGPGDVIFDGISLVGPQKEELVAPMPEYIPPAEGVENLIYDPGFEKNSFDYLENTQESLNVWYSRAKTFGGFWEITSDEARTGNSSMRLKFDGATSMPWVAQTVPVTPGQEYQFSAWIKVANGSQSFMVLQADAYSGINQTEETYMKQGQKNSRFVVDQLSEEWQHVTARFTAYAGTSYYALLMRAGADYPYELYIDDVEFFPISTSSAVMHMLETDEVFYYSDWTGDGHAKVSTYVDRNPQLAGAPLRFRLLDGEKVLKEEVISLSQDGKGEFSYDLDLLSEKKKEYKVEARILNADGTPSEFFLERIIYKYDRPTLLDENMKFLANGGKVINYVLAQGSTEEVMCVVAETGCTVGRIIGSGRTTMMEKLDIAQANGMMATVTLYNHEDIRDPVVKQRVIDRINMVKDHPALFGWYLWEEPGFTGDSIDLDENIRIGTKIIRDMDPDHPIGSVISDKTYYDRLVTYNDWLDLDCYPAQAYDGRTQYIADNVAHAMEVSDWQKNMSIMIQAFEWFDYKPSWDEMRSFIYQSFFEGGSGFSFHAFGKDVAATVEAGTSVCIGDEHWNAMKDSQWEYDFMFDHFVNEKYPLFNEARTPGVRWRLAVVDDALYAIVLNMSDTETNHIDIQLQSYDGKVTVNGFKAELLAGGEKKTVSVNGDTLSLDVPGFGALLYKITPKTKTDFSGVKGSRFRDLYNHVWAREAIITLDEAGIVNDKSQIAFGAKDNITRGDFAMFLVRTLGLTSDAAENFADVKPHAEYAKELATGRAMGILNGVGDNKFNPTAQITRQDMMTMTSRAMKLTGETDLGGFSDNGLIADYAASHVAAMVAEGLVKGNADGTINPLGNTTRAEAAVIMSRILEK